MPQVRDQMSIYVEVVSPDSSVKDAAQKMKDLDVGILPVCDGNRLVGMLTDRDITLRSTANGKDPRLTTVSEIMSKKVEWCLEDDEIDLVAKKMEHKRIRRIPVISHDKKLVGLLSLGDLAVRGSLDVACEVLEKVSAPA
jgi:CBS domain-containing protein